MGNPSIKAIRAVRVRDIQVSFLSMLWSESLALRNEQEIHEDRQPEAGA